MESFISNGKLGSGLPSSICGKLVFSMSTFAGRFSRAMVRAFRRRFYERRINLNPQLRAASAWWINAMRCAPPRPIPWNLSYLPTVVSYSDGEGSEAGVGVAIWSALLPVPQAGRIDVPRDIRQLWSSQRANPDGSFYDIQEVEGIGPLLVLSTWPHVLKGALWLHFIDNNGALSSLVKGGSSACGTDSIVGLTWKMIGSAQALPWFDRVDTKSNPVDGLSRKFLDGPWQIIDLVFPGSSLRAAIRRGKKFNPPS